MKIPQASYRVALALAAACLVLAIAAVALDAGNRRLQSRLQQELSAVQGELQKVSGVETISRNILDDLGRVAATNVEIRVLLARYGYSLAGTTNAVAGEDSP